MVKHAPAQTVAILNFGSQHTLEIKDAVQRLGVHAEVLPYNVDPALLKDYTALIFSGGSASVYDEKAPQLNPAIRAMKKPTYGICYGAQLIARDYGGVVEPGSSSEFGQHQIHRHKGATALGVIAGTGDSEKVWMNHGDRITKVPRGFEVTAVSEGGIIAGFQSADASLIGVQFHPEVSGEDRTEHGDDLFARFLFDIAKIEPTFKPTTIEARKETVAKEIGTRHVLMFISGGVDSSVMAKLIQASVPAQQVHAVYIDHGFMRQGEAEHVKKMLSKAGIDIYVYDARDYFLNASTDSDTGKTPKLKEVWLPEVKRKIIGDAFIKIQREVAAEFKLPDDYVLAQGSIRPDLIESGSHGTETIKTHHNDSSLARALRAEGRVIEPIADLYKPGVRALGKALDLPEEIVMRQPFPGPGLAVRILCEARTALSKEEEHELKEAQQQLEKLSTKATSLVVIPVRSVGQQGDGRRYGRTVVLSGKEDWDTLLALAKRIPEQYKDVTRVTYAFGEQISAAGLSQVLTPTLLNEPVINQLRQADAIVREEISAAGLNALLQQVPVILIPHSIDKKAVGNRSIVLRPFLTTNFMTGTPAIPGSKLMPLSTLHKIVSRILDEVPGISRVLYDLTGKPPGTTEWE